MASINDLAAAATIASSAVALQPSPTEPAAQPAPLSSPPRPPPLSPSAAAAVQPTPPSAPATQENSAPVEGPPPSPEPPAGVAPSSSSTSIQPPQPTPPPLASAVLAAPQISPQDAVSAQFPAPAPAVVPAAADGPAPGMVSATQNGPDGIDGSAPARQKPVRGAFVVFEGMDRAGKTTQAKLLQQRCIEEGKEVKFMRFPDRTTPIGQMIDAYLRGQTEIEDHVIHLLFSANRWEALKTIQTTLAAGVSIICDRYYHSGIVYSAAKQNPSLPLSWAKAPEVGLPRPDLVLFLDLDERVARERGGWGGEVYEKGEMQRRVRELFWDLNMGGPGRSPGRERRAASAPHGTGSAPNNGGGAADKDEFRQEAEDLQIIDADLPVEDLAEKVWAHVQPRLETVERGNEGASVRTVH